MFRFYASKKIYIWNNFKILYKLTNQKCIILFSLNLEIKKKKLYAGIEKKNNN